ncbi:serine/threonine-protein kinase [Streptomyces sp. NPDC052811]|uniref:serine/threonine-protein kinase n=1 Tax=Streptomyces sp. NPDC052811 TaxID=3155731 RepID=UPI0034245573
MSTGQSHLLAGRYRVLAQLGRGGMGVVWRAHDEVLGREVAVKELRAYTDASAPELGDLRLRMQREARAAARVRHPGVVAVHDVAEHEGRPVIVMELIDGPSLDDVLGERGVLDPREASAIGAKVLEALDAAHGAGVLHRDVKPGNVLLDASGRVVLTDFGIAAMDDPGDGSQTHLTRSGEIVGSLDYLAPERAQGQEPGPASDIWALGATLYAAVEGAAPFRRTSTWSTLNAIVVEPLPEARRTGPLGPVLERLMDKDPARRPDAATAARLLADIAAAADTAATKPAAPLAAAPRTATVRDVLPHRPEGFGPVVTHVSEPEPEPRPAAGRSRGKVLVAACVAAVLLVGAGVGYALLDRTDTPSGQQEAAGAANSAAPDGEQGGVARITGSPSAGDAHGSPSPGAPASSAPSSSASKPGRNDDGAKSGAGSSPEPRKSPSAPNSGGPGGTSGGAQPPSGSCQAIAGGKYDCQVWRTATSYRQGGATAGVLKAGTNYFYCQSDLGRRETYGKWTNTWWARTDDDSGNTNVYVSVVYLKGGDNNQPVPGLKVC